MPAVARAPQPTLSRHHSSFQVAPGDGIAAGMTPLDEGVRLKGVK